MNGCVLLTGATGFLGTWFARRLLEEPEFALIAVVRARDDETAAHRLRRVWWGKPDLIAAIGTRITVVAGDVSAIRLGVDERRYAELVGSVTHIVHTAADLRLDAPLAALRLTNVIGTANLLSFAQSAHSDHGLSRFAHVSTAYVCGKRQGVIAENDLSDAAGFANGYEQSKYEGEALVRAVQDVIPVSIFRPGMIVGDSRTGEIATFNTVYPLLRRYLTGHLLVLPVRGDLRLNLVPVDQVAETVVRLTLDPGAIGTTFHLTSPPESSPTMQDVFAVARSWAHDHLDVDVPQPIFVPAVEIAKQVARLGGHDRPFLQALLPYAEDTRVFRRDNVEQLLVPGTLDWSTILPRLLAFAVKKGFLHHSERTVHEQMLFRLEHSTRPIVYRDLADKRLTTRNAADIRTETLRVVSALRALGVARGDRVALVGLNASRFLTLDLAIGLVGAVSVPIYYTSPPAEIDAILASSGARLLCIGAPAVLARVAELTTNSQIVSFCRADHAIAPTRPVLGWQQFLTLGDEKPNSEIASVGFDDPATIRYTSGTTGRPKGAIFTHGQLRWLAETMAEILPWSTRTRPARHLSFLPLNHVVEGILAAYAPYYLPAPVTITFLEDFHDLQSALPTVRPTIFFAVPRVYEHVWQGFAASGPGRHYLQQSNGIAKNILRLALRRSLLRRAGLNRCDQLIVGSAPADEQLLNQFSALGIEIHDAYGLTEAPLITLNRRGSNRIGTVGEPLPDTEIQTDDDGEILVRGPQVSRCYIEPDLPSPLHDGWLRTGDLGRMTSDGYLVIEGRKKEVIATSYGKKIFPAKIEAMLREIPGVVEAMLVGDDRPYCVAILWVGPEPLNHGIVANGIAEVNARLSHPEQVRRWASLPYDLSIERGDLTANLKLRRSVVLPRLRPTIDALYAVESDEHQTLLIPEQGAAGGIRR